MGFPNVPNLPGVPPLPRPVSIPAPARQALGIAVARGWKAISKRPQWGVYDKNDKPLFNPEDFRFQNTESFNQLLGFRNEVSTLGVEYTKESRTSGFPTEKGGFAAYNKVEVPGAAYVTLCLGGSVQDRTKFLEALDFAVKSTDLYKIFVPEKQYVNYSIDRYSYSRTAENGANLLTVTLDISEQRFVESRKTRQDVVRVDAKNPEGKSTKDSGKVQATPASESLLLKASNSLTNYWNELFK